MRSNLHSESSQIQYNKFKTIILGKMMIFSVIFTLFFAILDTLEVNNIGNEQALMNYIHALFVFPLCILFSKKKLSLAQTSYLFLFFCFLTSISALLFADKDSFRAIWFFLSTIIAFIFCGQKIGKSFGILAFSCIFAAGFIWESNLNTISVLSALVSLIVLILVISAFTEQIEKHLSHIDKVQQELNYLANKTAISSAINANDEAIRIEKLVQDAHRSGDYCAMLYIDIDHSDKLKAVLGAKTYDLLAEQVTEKVHGCVNKNDITSTMDGVFLYIVSLYSDHISGKNLADRIQQAVSPLNFIYGSNELAISVSISIAVLTPEDTSIRSLHIRADQGLVKAKTTGSGKIILVKSE